MDQEFDRSYFIADINDHFQYVIKKCFTQLYFHNAPIKICFNEIQNGKTFKIKKGYPLGLLTTET